jgi:hypothetical protein
MTFDRVAQGLDPNRRNETGGAETSERRIVPASSWRAITTESPDIARAGNQAGPDIPGM